MTFLDTAPGNRVRIAAPLQAPFFDLTYSFTLGHNNGNVAGITDNVTQSHSQSFMYDAVNRLSNATFFGSCEQYTYDNGGNLTAEQPFGTCTGVMWNMPADGNNRIMAYQSNYDGSGNLTYVTGLSGSSTFNSENQLASFSGNIVASFAYDGDGRRVRT